jgi:SH3-like domain-containing protein
MFFRGFRGLCDIGLADGAPRRAWSERRSSGALAALALVLCALPALAETRASDLAAIAPEPRPEAATRAPAGSVAPVDSAQPAAAASGSQATPAVVRAPQTGPVTNLPLPRFVSLKASEGNVRRGPSLTHRIDWVFKHRNMPLEVTGEFGHWRRVRDRDGAGGWIHYSLISGARTVIIEEDLTPLRSQPHPEAPVRARAELGVIARLEGCENEWCRLRVGRARGWVPSAALWGVTHEPPPATAQTYSGLAITR